MRVRAFIVLAGAVVLLGGCTVAPPTESSPSSGATPDDRPSLIPSDVAPDSAPGFLADPVDPDHPLPPAVAETYDLDPAAVWFQGEFESEAVYLYVAGAVDAGMVTFDIVDPGMSASGRTTGNSPMGLDVIAPDGDRWILQYVPQGTADLPDEWTALSDWVAWRQL